MRVADMGLQILGHGFQRFEQFREDPSIGLTRVFGSLTKIEVL
jgi:hypothetical protein